MAKALDLSPLDDLFAKGEDFELTDVQYEEKSKNHCQKMQVTSKENHLWQEKHKRTDSLFLR